MLEPTEALESTENALRLIVRLLLPVDWMSKLSDEKLASCQQRMDEEAKRRDGVVTSRDLLEFTDFTDLTRLILKTWETFNPVFDDKKRTEVFLSHFEDVRNAIAHCRPLAPHERELLSGMATQLRNQIGLYRMDKDPASKHYPLIESAVDGLMREGRTSPVQSQLDSLPRLEVGEVLNIEARATDPRGRELEWYLARVTSGSLYMIDRRPVKGGTVTVSVTIEEIDVAEQTHFILFMRSAGRFHRHSVSIWVDTEPGDEEKTTSRWYSGLDYDDCRYFYLAVNPPMD